MAITTTEYEGWQDCLSLSNGKIEAIITTEVGPRIISLRAGEGRNVMKNVPEEMGGSGEEEWLLRGGHRIWLAPEDTMITYVPDNDPVEHQILDGNSVRLVNAPVAPWKIKKEMRVSISTETPALEIVHKATNEGNAALSLATWGPTVMAPGGLLVIPLPPTGEHPRDLLPNRTMILWPYTDLSDPRYSFGRRFITLKQESDRGPTKLGLFHTEGWVAYLLEDNLFVKYFESRLDAVYPDMGSNFETFTREDMLEIETLGPLAMLNGGDSVSHSEKWALLSGVQPPDTSNEEALAEWIEPLLQQTGLVGAGSKG